MIYWLKWTSIELIWTITPALILVVIAFPSFRLLYLLDEVISPTITIKVSGFFLGGLKLYILNKMKDTNLNLIGQKNNTCYQSIPNYTTKMDNKNINFRSKWDINSRLDYIQQRNLFNFSIQNQRRYFHISNIKSKNRIGPHNEDVISVIIGSLLGDASYPLFINKPFSTLIKVPLNPNWITGFTDAERTFIISITRSEDRAIGWRVTPIFSIKLHGNDLQLLSKIQSFFGIGSITTNKKNGQVIYSVKSIEGINSIIIPHFDKYTLLTKKQADFVLFKKIVELIIHKHHLKEEGLRKILELKASLNKGLSPELEKAFPNIKPVHRPLVQLPVNLDTNWLIGFIDGEGSFGVNITKGTTKIGYVVQINFNLTQHIRDADLFKFIQRCLGAGLIYEIPKDSRVNLVITNLQDLIEILIPKLNQYPLQGIKRLNFEDFKLVAELISKKEHLTLEGLNKIRQIKSGMNTGRIINNEEKIKNTSAGDTLSHEAISNNQEARSDILDLQKPSLSYSFNKVQKRSFHTNVRASLRIGPHNQDVISVIIGSLLGNSRLNPKPIEGTRIYLRLNSDMDYANNRNKDSIRICYRQSIIHKEYLFWLYNFFYTRGYTSNLQPRQYTRTIKSRPGIVYYGFEFNTFTFKSFNWIHKMFYKNGIKQVPAKIAEYLTPLALAVWIMDDGCWVNSGIRIATNSFQLKELELIREVLKSKYNLETTIQKLSNKNLYSLYIKKESINNIREILLPYMHSSMYYKLGIDNTI